MGLPVWGGCHLKAFLAILKGDVAKHREYNLRGMALAVGVVLMRVVSALLQEAGLEEDGSTALKIAVWMVWMVSGG